MNINIKGKEFRIIISLGTIIFRYRESENPYARKPISSIGYTKKDGYLKQNAKLIKALNVEVKNKLENGNND